MKLISGSSNKNLAQNIAAKLGTSLINVELGHFANGENRVRITDNIKGEDIVIIQSFSKPSNENIMEFLLIADAADRAGAKKITAVLPWLAYSFQDKVFRPGEPIAAKVIANLVSNSDVERAFLLDLHNTSTPGFFSIPTEHLSAEDTFVDLVSKKFSKGDLIVASPDFGGLKKSRSFAEKLDTDLVNINKHRDLETGAVDSVEADGADVSGKVVVLYDDAILSGSTVIETSKLLKKLGAKQVHFYATHGIFTGDAQKNLAKSDVDSIVITNSVHHDKLEHSIEVIDISELFADSLKTWQ